MGRYYITFIWRDRPIGGGWRSWSNPVVIRRFFWRKPSDNKLLLEARSYAKIHGDGFHLVQVKDVRIVDELMSSM